MRRSSFASAIHAIVAHERQKSLMLRAWILSGLFFMALPGTLLGFSNLMAISTHHGLGTLPAAWIQGHGHAQMFGWIGSFILGIGFYSQPRTRRFGDQNSADLLHLLDLGRCIALGGQHLRMALAHLVSSLRRIELIAVFCFLPPLHTTSCLSPAQDEHTKPRMELWMVSVLIGNRGACCRGALQSC